MGIVGLPNVGKSTLFNALTKKAVPAENYPFCTIDPSVGVVGVPDDRLDKLGQFSQSQKILPAAIEFVDIAGLVAGAAAGEGLGNKFLANIREVDAIVHMVRLFQPKDEAAGDDIHHVLNSADPIRDAGVINAELILADLETVENRIAKIAKDVKRNDKEAIAENAVLQKLLPELQSEKLANSVDLNKDEEEIAKHFQLLTMKPVLYALNKKAGGNNFDETHGDEFTQFLKSIEEAGNQYVILDAATEHELNEFEGDEKHEMRAEMSAADHGVDELIRKSYELLGLITYFTTGQSETRAWTILKDSTAPEAGAAIHTDFKEKFIKADVIPWDELLEAGSYPDARAAGKVRLEGKEYVVKDGDVIEFKV